MMLALAGCIVSQSPIFDLSKGATDLPTGRFERRSGDDKFTVEIARQGNLYIYSDGDSRDTTILSFHAIGEGFYLVVVIPPGRPINYGVVDARLQDSSLSLSSNAATTRRPTLSPGPMLKALTAASLVIEHGSSP